MPEYSGPGHRLTKFYNYLKSSGAKFELQILCNSREYPNDESYIWEGYPVRRISSFLNHLLPENRGLFWRLIHTLKSYHEGFKTWKYLSSTKYDLLHVVGISSSTSAGIYHAYRTNNPKFIELVNADATPLQNLPLLRLNKLNVLNHKSVICCISNQLHEKCRNLGIKKIWSRPNPVDLDSYNVDLKIHPKNGNINLVCIGKFIPRKNQLFLIDVLSKLDDRFFLTLAGPLVLNGIHSKRDQEYFNSITQKIKDFALGSRVKIISEYVDASTQIKNSDIVLLPSFDEGLGTTMLEAMSCAVPVVANEGEPAYCQWVDHEINGFLCPLNAKLWADAILRCAELKECDLRVSSDRIKSEASHKVINQRTFSIFQHLVGSKPIPIFN